VHIVLRSDGDYSSYFNRLTLVLQYVVIFIVILMSS